MSEAISYNAKDVVLSLGKKHHTKECSYYKTNDRWKWVSLSEISEYVSKEGLFNFTHTIGDCIGHHVDDTPESEMKAKTCFSPDGIHYAVINTEYKYYECDCDGEVEYTEIKSFTGNKDKSTKEKTS